MIGIICAMQIEAEGILAISEALGSEELSVLYQAAR